MDHYITQLIEDMHAARSKTTPPSQQWDYVDFEDHGEIEDMSYVEEFLYGEKKPLSQITGIDTHFLPPPERLTPHQKETLASEIEALLLHFNFEADFPRSLPQREKYPFLRELWDQKFTEVSFGTIHIEFCEYDLESCPFPEHCKVCEEMIIQMKQEEEEEKRNQSNRFMEDGDNVDDLFPF